MQNSKLFNYLANKKIGIVGAHSCGKTTLVNYLKNNVNTNFILEIAAEFPPEIRLSLNVQLEIMAKQIEEEKQYDNFISDRTIYDNRAYFELVNNKYDTKNTFKPEIVHEYEHIWWKHTLSNPKPYDLIIFVNELLPLVEAPHRNFMNVYDQKYIFNKLKDLMYIARFCEEIPILYVYGSTEQRLEQILHWVDNR